MAINLTFYSFIVDLFARSAKEASISTLKDPKSREHWEIVAPCLKTVNANEYQKFERLLSMKSNLLADVLAAGPLKCWYGNILSLNMNLFELRPHLQPHWQTNGIKAYDDLEIVRRVQSL